MAVSCIRVSGPVLLYPRTNARGNLRVTARDALSALDTAKFNACVQIMSVPTSLCVQCASLWIAESKSLEIFSCLEKVGQNSWHMAMCNDELFDRQNVEAFTRLVSQIQPNSFKANQTHMAIVEPGLRRPNRPPVLSFATLVLAVDVVFSLPQGVWFVSLSLHIIFPFWGTIRFLLPLQARGVPHDAACFLWSRARGYMVRGCFWNQKLANLELVNILLFCQVGGEKNCQKKVGAQLISSRFIRVAKKLSSNQATIWAFSCWCCSSN